jgi:hypothetical protein
MWRADSVRCSSVMGGKAIGSHSRRPPARATIRWAVWASASYGGSVITTSTDPSRSAAMSARQSPVWSSQAGGALGALAGVDSPTALAFLLFAIAGQTPRWSYPSGLTRC